MHYYISDSHLEGSLFVPLLPATSDRSFLVPNGPGGACREQSHHCAIQQPWDLVGSYLLQHLAPQLGHRNTYSSGLRRENQAHKLLKHDTDLCSKLFPPWLGQNPSWGSLGGGGSCRSGVSGCCRVQPTLLGRDFCAK